MRTQADDEIYTTVILQNTRDYQNENIIKYVSLQVEWTWSSV